MGTIKMFTNLSFVTISEFLTFPNHHVQWFPCRNVKQSYSVDVRRSSMTIDKDKYFGQKRPPRGGNKFNSRKNREEIQFQRKSKKLTMFMSFMDIFPVFDEFLLNFPSYLLNLMSFTQSRLNIFGASRHLRLYFAQFCDTNND